MARAAFTCSESGKASLIHGVADTALLTDSHGYPLFEPESHVDELTINCLILPTATPTALGATSTPPAVGGFATDAGGEGQVSWWWPITAVLAVLALSGGVYAVLRR